MAARVAAAAAIVLASSFIIRRQLNRKTKSSKNLSKTYNGSPRLPRTVLPRRYNIELTPDLDARAFQGKQAITLDIVEPTANIILNAADLTIKKDTVWLRGKDSRQCYFWQILWPVSQELYEEEELVILKFDQPLPIGEAILGMEFNGTLNDQMKGFYRSSYEAGGERRNMAVTQFEPADARRCFPCWDEPNFKAVFKLTVHVHVDRVVLSNMPIVDEQAIGKIKTIHFEDSPLMSTYLVALVVGEFDYIEGITKEGNKVRVYTAHGKTEQGRFALEVATRVLPFYAEYFGTTYPLPKLDMVAVPDFAAGAMENYGLVTYRDTQLLFDEKNSAAANKQRVAIVVAHELAHQWFGNLVTMEWWTHLWLNEGFATWVSYLAVEHHFPEWKIWTQFSDLTVDAFRLDGLVQSHPIEVEVGHVREVDEIFDAISYEKGATIIRMLQNYLGPQKFQKGLVSYIKRYAYKNATTEDLWNVLSEESGEPVRELMNSWTKQKGYPVVFVKAKGDVLELEQTQYLTSGLPGPGEWVIPLTLCRTTYTRITSALMRAKSHQVMKPGLDKLFEVESGETGGHAINALKAEDISQEHRNDWLKLNVGQTGFYRVQYDEELAASLRSAILAGALEATDRLGVLDDTYALCKACKQPFAILLSLMEVYRCETDYTVLTNLIGVAYGVFQAIADARPDAAKDAKRFIASLLQHPAKRLGWDVVAGESHLDSMLRGELLTGLVDFNDEETIMEAKRRFDIFLKDRSTSVLPPDTRKAAFKAAMLDANGSDKSSYQALLKIYRETDLSHEKVRILVSLAASTDPNLVREALDFSLSSEVRSHDAVYVLNGISREGREAAWIWLKENWNKIWNIWSKGFLITRFVTSVALKFSSDEKADEINEFFTSNGNPAIERTVSQTVEHVRLNSQLVRYIREEEGLQEFLKQLATK
ncbi:hypothetical protein O6H91_04G121900 [Diphasiastrum complanatum]|uniref:Uncharacterized protein n=1 Tax=Diphasiastrum complanatum TaxID=34168 RepID=A0ACC2E1I0_DIPCM|nr:hypothetical protein O6H91_04G121900 [Diphasiastrum complanatum]